MAEDAVVEKALAEIARTEQPLLLTEAERLLHEGIAARERLLNLDAARFNQDAGAVLRQLEAAHGLAPGALGTTHVVLESRQIVPKQ